jgi:hypothetical protein
MSDKPAVASRLLGERVFSHDAQIRFADESHDFNPIHVDPVVARRLIAGRQAVHGVHTLIQALDIWPARDVGTMDGLTLQCNFAHPVGIGDRVEFVELPDWHGQHRLAAMVDGVSAMDVACGSADATAPVDWDVPRRALGAVSEPLDMPPESFVDQAFDIEPWQDGLAEWYPGAAARLGAAALSHLAQLSFMVGMVCPGLHSVLLSLRFTVKPAAGRGPLLVKVLRYDPRYRLFFIAFQGAVQGELRAALRPLPQMQPRSLDLVGHVKADSWAGRRALVVGGSRGLGETTAKLLAAAGADVTITHARGRDDALVVERDIRSLNRGHCDILALDLSKRFVPPPSLSPADLDAMFYFATPRIHARRSGVFHRGTFDELAAFYVDRFQELCLWLESGGRPVRVYMPSSVFVSERPRGMTEYAMVKAAAELLADDLNRSLRHVRIVYSRLPRLATDQTALVARLSVSDNVAALRSVLEAMTV